MSQGGIVVLHDTHTYREIKQQPATLKKTYDLVQAQQARFEKFIAKIEQENQDN